MIEKKGEYFADQIGGWIESGEARSPPRIPRATMANDTLT